MKDELSTSNEQLLTIDAVVLANGEYPASPLPLKILAEAPYVVCCDGGADEYTAQFTYNGTDAGAILPT